MKKILVPTDFSKPAKVAIDVAAEIAKRSDGKIILLHVVEQPGSESFNVEAQVKHGDDWETRLFTMKLIQRTKDLLAAEAERLEAMGVRVSTELKLGNPFHGISGVIADHDVDLVVMGTSGRSKLEEMLIGSNTEKVIRQAHCPVLTVNEKTTNRDYKNIVYASSLSDDEKDFAGVVRNAQRMYDSTIHLVRINTPSNFQPDFSVEKAMKDFAKKTRLSNYTFNSYSDFSEEEGIMHFAESIDADLIVMSTHGRKGFAHVLAGSIAEDVANHARRPVLTSVVKSKTTAKVKA